MAMGPKLVVLKLGEQGSVGFTANATAKVPPYTVKRVVDTVGAGDAFAAGFLSAFLEYGSPEVEAHLVHALERANCMGALATQYKGDWEGLPRRDELLRLLSGGRETTR